MKINHYKISDTGLKRDHNEDSVLVNTGQGLYLLADGIGGHAGGEAASKLTLNTVLKTFMEKDDLGDEDIESLHESNKGLPSPGRKLVFSILQANRVVIAASNKYKKLKGMGATITAILNVPASLFIAHVGDSRIYLLHGGALKQITEDHSFLVQELKKGTITAEQAKKSPFRNRLTKAIGHMNTNRVDVQELNPEKGDLFLLCSDGLTDMLDDGEIQKILEENAALEPTGKKLVEAANNAGGIDNISIVLVRVEEN